MKKRRLAVASLVPQAFAFSFSVAPPSRRCTTIFQPDPTHLVRASKLSAHSQVYSADRESSLIADTHAVKHSGRPLSGTDDYVAGPGLIKNPPAKLVLAWMLRAGKEGRWVSALTYLKKQLKAAADADVKIDIRLYNAAIQAVAQAGQRRQALRMLKEMKEKCGHEPDCYTYGAALNACAVTKSHRDALVLLKDMVERGVPRNEVIFSTVLRTLEGARDADGPRIAEQLLEQMELDGVPPTSWVLSAAIRVCAKAGDWKAAVGLLKDMLPRYGLTPTPQAYAAAIHACDRGGAWAEAVALLKAMDIPDLRCYNSAISACSRGGEWQLAASLLREMRTVGLKADAISYNSVITACGRAGKWEMSLELLESMGRAGIAPVIGSYNAALTACADSRQWPAAVELFNTLKVQAANVTSAFGEEHGVQDASRPSSTVLPDLFTYNIVMDCLAQMRQYRQALALKEEMIQLGVKPDAFTYTSLALSFARAVPPQSRRAVQLLQEMEMEGIAPVNNTYSCVLSAVGRAGEDREVLTLLDTMESEGRPANGLCLQAALSGLARSKNIDAALTVFDKIRDRDGGVQMTSYTYTSVIRACQENGRWKEAYELLGELREKGGEGANEGALYTQWHDALGLLASSAAGGAVTSLGVASSPKTILAAMAGASQAGKWQETLQLMALLTARGHDPGPVGYSTTINAFTVAGESDRGLALFGDLQARARNGMCAPPDILCYVAAANCCEKSAQWERALVLLKEAKDQGLVATRRLNIATVRACRAAGTPDAFEALWQLRSIGGGVPLQMEVIAACGDSRRPDRVMEFLSELTADTAPEALDPALYTSAVGALEACGEAMEAELLLAKAERIGALSDPAPLVGRQTRGAVTTVDLSACGTRIVRSALRRALRKASTIVVDRTSDMAGGIDLVLIVGIGPGSVERRAAILEMLSAADVDCRADNQNMGSLRLPIVQVKEWAQRATHILI